MKDLNLFADLVQIRDQYGDWRAVLDDLIDLYGSDD